MKYILRGKTSGMEIFCLKHYISLNNSVNTHHYIVTLKLLLFLNFHFTVKHFCWYMSKVLLAQEKKIWL